MCVTGRIENTMPTPSRLYREAARRGLAVGFVSRDQSGLNALLSSEQNFVSTDNFQITHKRKPNNACLLEFPLCLQSSSQTKGLWQSIADFYCSLNNSKRGNLATSVDLDSAARKSRKPTSLVIIFTHLTNNQSSDLPLVHSLKTDNAAIKF